MILEVNGVTIGEVNGSFIPQMRNLEQIEMAHDVMKITTQPQALPVCYAERELINQGKRIHAIKSYRERTGLGLKESYDIIKKIYARSV
jgi:ribosomal protein L7/L12